MRVTEKSSNVCDDLIHRNPSLIQVIPNWQGFEPSQGTKNLEIF